MNTVICPGSFDPVTLGHLDIIKRASLMFEKVIVAVMINLSKASTFSLEERLLLLEKATKHICNVEIMAFDGLLADLAKSVDTNIIVKGVRCDVDFNYEFQMALANNSLNCSLETIFLPAKPENIFLSSTMVKEVAKLHGDISKFVPQEIIIDITNKF